MIIIDRFEGNTAVCETDDKFIEINRSIISDDISEGDVIYFNGEIYVKDKNVTKERRKHIYDIIKK